MYKGFTLIELVVVMGIIGLISTLAIVGIISYRSTVELNSVYSEVVSLIKTQRNNATNSIGYADEDGNLYIPDFYAIRIFEDKYQSQVCSKNGIGNTIRCNDDVNIQENAFAREIVITSNCAGIGFESIKQNIVKISPEAFINTGGYEDDTILENCRIEIKHNQTNFIKEIIIQINNDQANF